MKTILIELHQFENYKECRWIQSLIFLASNWFKKEIIADKLCLQIKQNQDYKLDLDKLCEASGVDFKYSVLNASIEEIKTVLNRIIK